MDTTQVGFFTFLSETIGSGHPILDAISLAAFGFVVTLLVRTLQKAGQGVEITAKEAELLSNISTLLSTMNIQLIEMKASVAHEFDRFNADLTFLKQEILDLQRVADEAMRTKAQEEYLAKPVVEDLHGLFAASASSLSYDDEM